VVHLLCVLLEKIYIWINIHYNRLFIKTDRVYHLFWIKNDRTSISFSFVILYNGFEKFLHFTFWIWKIDCVVWLLNLNFGSFRSISVCWAERKRNKKIAGLCIYFIYCILDQEGLLQMCLELELCLTFNKCL